MSKAKIKKIEIKIGKKILSLSLKQAKELKGALDELFFTYPQPCVDGYEWWYTMGNAVTNSGTISLNISSK